MAQTIDTTVSPQTKLSEALEMTFEEFLVWSDEDTFAEWVNGKVILMAPASDGHQDLASFLTALLRFFVERFEMGWLRPAPFLMKIGPDLPGREPDLLFVTNENRGRVKENYLDGPADLVIEIVSPESRGRDRGDKYDEYERGGIPEYWLLDRKRKQAEFYGLGDDGYYHLIPPDENGVFHSRVMSGLWLKVDWLWQEPLPTLSFVPKEWKLI